MQNDLGVDLQSPLVGVECVALTHTGLEHRFIANGRLTTAHFESKPFKFLDAFVVASMMLLKAGRGTTD